MSRYRKGLGSLWLIVIMMALIWLGVHTATAQGTPDPGLPGPCTVSSQAITVTADLETLIVFPSDDQCPTSFSAPYPAIAFAHGFSMLGLSDGAADNAGNGEHLASWGFVVAIPSLPDDIDLRLSAMQDVMSYLETANSTPDSFLFGKVDTARLAASGHSLGGATALALTAADLRVKAVSVLDPVYHSGNPFSGQEQLWDPVTDGPLITVPTSILGAPPTDCNSQADFAEIYPLISATHKTQFFVVDASHCDFADPGNDLCYTFCGDTDDPTGTITQLSQKYMTAWFTYYLHNQTDHYTYIYGDQLDSDVQTGLITPTIQTATRDLVASGRFGSVELHWTPYDHPIIAGYNVYRREQGGTYPPAPLVQVGRISSYTDQDVVPGQEYVYIVHSRDAAGNQHQPSDEASGTPQGTPMLLAPPDGTVTTTQEITFTWQAGAGPPPVGYNLSLNGSVITTTHTTWDTVLPAGIHTWTVQAYNAADHSDWVSPSWTIEVTETLPPPSIPLLLAPLDGTVTATQALTFTWRASPGALPSGYNLNLGDLVFTTTGTTWATLLPIGVHTWTVRAYNSADYSDWVSPSWTVEVTEILPPPSTPTLLTPPDNSITTTQTITFAWRPNPGAISNGYNLRLDGDTVTTTGTTWATLLPIGVHTWTVQAYNGAGASLWAAPWRLEIRTYQIYLPQVLRDAQSGSAQIP